MTARKPSAASRAGLAPVTAPVPDPVDPRLRPWWERCRRDHDRLVEIQGHHVTTYQARLQYQQFRQLLDAYRILAQDYAALLHYAEEVADVLRSLDIQPTLPLPELRELPTIAHEVAPTKRGSSPATAV